MSVDEAVKSHLASSLANFWDGSTSADPLAPALVAVDELSAAACLTNHLPAIDPVTCAQLRVAIERATPAIADAVKRYHAPDQIYLWLTAAAGLVEGGDPDLHIDRFLYIKLLVSEICVVACRRTISERGDPLAQIIAINRANAAERGSEELH